MNERQKVDRAGHYRLSIFHDPLIRIWAALALAMLVLLCRGVCEGETGRELTLMVYVCGSNLESAYGSASADVEEMLEAGRENERVSLLVMTGGSMNWSLGFDTAKTTISEIGTRGLRIRWQSEAMNMGDPAALTWLLSFGMEQYPAEKYALILWDHGGGPLEGICWDELFSMDHMTLEEVTEAIAAAKYPQRLSWIGLDACLMSSVEVASALAPYAEYMIASQETEPDSGWNYTFIRELCQPDREDGSSADKTKAGISPEPDGAAAGKLIADAYFAERERSSEALTLACTDLSRVAKVVSEMDRLFAGVEGKLGAEAFGAQSRRVQKTPFYGRGMDGIGGDGYDLVDLGHLAENMPDAGQLAQAVDEAVVYARSAGAGSSGLSVYHPFSNRRKYEERWRENYLNLDFCDGYTRYIDRFASWLTGAEMTFWGKMDTLDAGWFQEKENLFTLQLTPQQREHFASAQLLILLDESAAVGGQGIYRLVYSAPAEMDERGQVQASYSGRTIYAETADGQELGPLSMILPWQTREGTIFSYSFPAEATAMEDGVLSAHRLSLETAEEPVILDTLVYDEVTEVFTNRISHSGAGDKLMYFWNIRRKLPAETADGQLPGFMDWDQVDGNVSYFPLTLPAEWRFRYQETQQSGAKLAAVFQVTDVQRNTFCSMPVQVRNPNVKEVLVTGLQAEGCPLILKAEALLDTSLQTAGVEVTMTVTNTLATNCWLTAGELVLNGRRATGQRFGGLSLAAGETGRTKVRIGPEGLAWLEKLTEARCTITLKQEDGEASQDIPLVLRFEPADLKAAFAAPEALAETETAEGIWRLLSLESAGNGGVKGTVYVDNRSGNSLGGTGFLAVNGLAMESCQTGTVPAGMDGFLSFTARNVAGLDSFRAEIAGTEYPVYTIVLSEGLLAKHGILEAKELTLRMNYDWITEKYATEVSFKLQIPWPIPEEDHLEDGSLAWGFVRYGAAADVSAYGLLPLVKEEKVQAGVETIVLGENSVLICLEMYNGSDEEVTVKPASALVNGQPAAWESGFNTTLDPGMTQIVAGCITGDALRTGLIVEAVTLGFSCSDNGKTEEATFRLKEPAALGQAGGLLLLSGELERVE